MLFIVKQYQTMDVSLKNENYNYYYYYMGKFLLFFILHEALYILDLTKHDCIIFFTVALYAGLVAFMQVIAILSFGRV